MSYYEKVLNDNAEFVRTIPAINMKLRDKIKFRGSSIEYDEFTKFAKCDKYWLPVWAFPKDKKPVESDVRDFMPLLCVGAAEMIHTPSRITGDGLSYFNGLICSESFSDLMTCIEFGRKCYLLELSDKNFNDLTLLSSLRFYRTSYLEDDLRQAVNLLFCMGCLDRKVFIESIFGVVYFSYAFCAQYYTPIDKLTGGGLIKCSSDGSERTDIPVSKLVNENDLKFGVLKYKIPSSEKFHSISDGRGLGIYSFLILMYCLFEKYGLFSSDSLDIKLTDTETKEFIQKSFKSCLGDDVTADIIKSGSVKKKNDVMKSSNTELSFRRGSMCFCADEMYKVDEHHTFSRDVYEELKLFEKSCGVKLKKLKGNDSVPVNKHYSSPFEVSKTIGRLFCLSDEFLISPEFTDEEIIEHISQSSFRPKLRKVCENVGLNVNNSEVTKLKNDLSEISSKYENLSETYDKECESYQWQLNQKDEQIRKMREELASLKSELSNMFSDVSDIGDNENIGVASDVSIDEMIEVLNSVQFGMVGGINDIENKVRDLGWKSVVWYNDCGDIKGTPVNLDFVCIHSKFCAHKTIYYIKDTYALDTIMYFNGTNVNLLVKSCYEFVMKYMG